MNISTYTPVKAGDLGTVPKDAQWVDSVLESRDSQLEDLSRALQGRLSPDENLNAEYRDVSVLHNTEFLLTLQKVRGACKGVLLLGSDLYDFALVAWRQIDTSEILVKISFSTAPADHVGVRLLVMGA